MTNKLTARLIVPNGAEAIAYYVDVFGARELQRHTDPEGRIIQAELALGESTLLLTDEAPRWHNHAPKSLGGTPVLLSLQLDDPDKVWASAIAKGAKVIFPLADHDYGQRAGRLQDPFGHVWILFKPL